MKQVLRITYEETDYSYQVINETPINSTTSEIHVLLEGEKYVLVKNNSKMWVAKEVAASIDSSLLHAIGRTVSLRYRMY
jgi:hypothetical protein